MLKAQVLTAAWLQATGKALASCTMIRYKSFVRSQCSNMNNSLCKKKLLEHTETVLINYGFTKIKSLKPMN